MSHNLYRIGVKKPNADGSISFGLDDLVNVGSIADGETLSYSESTSSFVGVTSPSGVVLPNFALFGQGQYNDYSNSGLSISVGAVWGFYDSSPVNYVSSYVTFNVNASDWLQSVTLQSGTYEIMVQTHATFSTSGSFDYVLTDLGGSTLSAVARVGNVHTSTGLPTIITQTLTITDPLDVYVTISALSGVSSTQGGVPAERGVIMVRRLL